MSQPVVRPHPASHVHDDRETPLSWGNRSPISSRVDVMLHAQCRGIKAIGLNGRMPPEQGHMLSLGD